MWPRRSPASWPATSSKVVLARDLAGRLPADADLPPGALATSPSATPTAGPSPSTASSARARRRWSRVNDGAVTRPRARRHASRGADAETDQQAAVAPRHQREGPGRAPVRRAERARRAARAQPRTCARSEMPFTLKLPNLWHLATDIEGTLTDGVDRRSTSSRPAPDRRGRRHPDHAAARPHRRARAVRPRPLRRTGRLGRRRRRRRVGDRPALRPGRRRTATITAYAGCRHRRRVGPANGTRRDPDEVPPDRRGLRLSSRPRLSSPRAGPARPRRRSRPPATAGRSPRRRRAAAAARRAARTTCGSAGTTNQGRPPSTSARARSGTPPVLRPELRARRCRPGCTSSACPAASSRAGSRAFCSSALMCSITLTIGCRPRRLLLELVDRRRSAARSPRRRRGRAPGAISTSS